MVQGVDHGFLRGRRLTNNALMTSRLNLR
jgi:hypothetical protein